MRNQNRQYFNAAINTIPINRTGNNQTSVEFAVPALWWGTVETCKNIPLYHLLKKDAAYIPMPKGRGFTPRFNKKIPAFGVAAPTAWDFQCDDINLSCNDACQHHHTLYPYYTIPWPDCKGRVLHTGKGKNVPTNIAIRCGMW